MMRKLINWLFSLDEIEDELEGVDDPCDDMNIERATYMYSGDFEEGRWIP